MVMCTVCGTTSADGSAHCGICGESFVAAAPRVSLWKLFSALGVALAGAFIYWHSRQPNTIISRGPQQAVNPLKEYSTTLTP